MIKNIVFDLSEVLIRGLLGIEETLSKTLNASNNDVLQAFGGSNFEVFLRGKIKEEEYLNNILSQTRWNLDVKDLQKEIYTNFRLTIENPTDLLAKLTGNFNLYLLSDHGKEWIQKIWDLHDFWHYFAREVYSYETGLLKKEPECFKHFLNVTALAEGETLFVDDNPMNISIAMKTGIKSHLFINQGILKEWIFKETGKNI